MQTTPVRSDMPDAPVQPPKKKRIGLWIVLAIVGVFVLSGVLGQEDPVQTGTPAAPATITEHEPAFEVTAQMIVDVMGTETVDQFCASYFLIDDYDMALRAFSEGYTETQPSPEDVFDEALSRC